MLEPDLAHSRAPQSSRVVSRRTARPAARVGTAQPTALARGNPFALAR